MPRPERGKTKTNQAISMRLYLDDDFQKRKKILLWQSQMAKTLPLLFSIGSSLQRVAGAHRRGRMHRHNLSTTTPAANPAATPEGQ
ncbi:MAG: hypothetical protein ACTHP8_17120 [Bosea sp. (in: a-proteobacteria)]|uniref:hypothetical protein n=1 Tax=unclassified Bosea (in: a-proteobacteria) TaxID=2653178 RepID=UPI001AC6FABB|nr:MULTISPECIES: hypothetical protein [unclassified Bosea (in: a-proteobacteria)]MBN9455517.1 hypothetical protein [Bosea sp. (in: a-proteobacteria)]